MSNHIIVKKDLNINALVPRKKILYYIEMQFDLKKLENIIVK